MDDLLCTTPAHAPSTPPGSTPPTPRVNITTRAPIAGGQHITCRVVTSFEGCIVDGRRIRFTTNAWGADARIDALHWSGLPGYAAAAAAIMDGNAPDGDFVFMRWKETRFISADPASGGACDAEQRQHLGVDMPAGVTITGFYYVCLHAVTGTIHALYYDPRCRPFQRLVMHPVPAGRDRWAEAASVRAGEDGEAQDRGGSFSFVSATAKEAMPLHRRKRGRHTWL